MNKTKFTPGPWMIGFKHDEMGVIAPGPVAIADCNYDPALSESEKQANARLIAAAPEMLEALRGMMEWARRVKEINPGMEVFSAISAIRKALGESYPEYPASHAASFTAMAKNAENN
jgi:hypothetical protein